MCARARTRLILFKLCRRASRYTTTRIGVKFVRQKTERDLHVEHERVYIRTRHQRPLFKIR